MVSDCVDRMGKFMINNPETDLYAFKRHMADRICLSCELVEKRLEEGIPLKIARANTK